MDNNIGDLKNHLMIISAPQAVLSTGHLGKSHSRWQSSIFFLTNYSYSW